MREGLRLFVDALPQEVEVAIATIGGRPQFRARHTSDREELMDAIGVVVPEMEGAASFSTRCTKKRSDCTRTRRASTFRSS